MATYGIPYQGSKSRHVRRIYRAVMSLNPPVKVLVDPFCGGGAVSHAFSLAGWRVLPSDANRYTVAAINQARVGMPEEAWEWVTRERFFDVLNHPENYPDWYVGTVLCCWSFGNGMSTYLFHRDLEASKKAGHDLVMHRRLSTLIPLSLEDQKKVALIPTRRGRRLALRQFSNLTPMLQQLQQLERLERLERSRFSAEVKCMDYRKAVDQVPEDSVIYLDPPYFGTKAYLDTETKKAGVFDHDEFWETAVRLAADHWVLVSEYSAPRDAPVRLLDQFSRPNQLAANLKSRAVEKIYLVEG